MGVKNPRIHTVLEPPLYRAVHRLARKAGVSLSQQVRDLVEDALVVLEDAGLDAFAERRRRTFHVSETVTMAAVRRNLRRR